MGPTMANSNAWRQMREARGYSIRELERRSGINRGRLSMIERGLAPSPDEAMAIVAVLRDLTVTAAAMVERQS
jgi:transcriptional regulator with XRE-family HTH domain